MARLGEFIKQIRGVSYKPEDICDELTDESVALLRANNIKDGRLDFQDVIYINKGRIKENQYLCAGDILVCTSSGSKDLVGKAAFVDRNLPMAFGAFCKVIRVTSGLPQYFGHFFDSPYYRTRISEVSAGANINNIRNEHIDELEIQMPSIPYQEHIVIILNQVNNLIALRKQQLDKLDELVKSRFVEMFGDPVRNTNHLPIKPLADLGRLERGRSQHRPRNAPELLCGPYPLIQTGDISNSGLYITTYQSTYSELGLKQSKLWKAGTLCITIAANIAQTAVLTFDACFPDSVVGFIPYDDISPVYIHYWFTFFQRILEEQAPQVAQKNINPKILSELNVIIPSHNEQSEFLEFVNRISIYALTIQQGLDKMEVMKKSLMQKYFE